MTSNQSKETFHNFRPFIVYFYIFSRQFYCPEQAYGNSKAAQILFTKYFNEKCKNEENCFVTINAVHPGIVNTDLYVHVGYMKVIVVTKLSN